MAAAVRDRLARALAELAVAVRIYGGLAAATGPSTQEQLRAELERYLAAAQDQQDRLSELPGTDPAARPVGWPLRGELISRSAGFAASCGGRRDHLAAAAAVPLLAAAAPGRPPATPLADPPAAVGVIPADSRPPDAD